MLIGVVAIAGGGASLPTARSGVPATTASPTTSSGAVTPAPPLSLLIEPDAGMSSIYALLGSARHAVDLTMYELEDTRAEQSLAAAAARGVDVRVVLNIVKTGSVNGAAFSYLRGHGVDVHWASARYALTHQKMLVVDRAVGVIMTLNWTSRYYADRRDVAVLDHIPSDLAAMEATFNADYDGTEIDPPSGADLVRSPSTSLPDLLALIAGTKHQLLVENEEMGNSDVVDALAAAARRGVNVDECMTDSGSWASAFGELTAAGVDIRVYSPSAALYIHAKVLGRDPGLSDREAFAGSQNFSAESLRYNRELGIDVTSETLITQLQVMIQRDENGAVAWSG